jgi:hypothetical protein
MLPNRSVRDRIDVRGDHAPDYQEIITLDAEPPLLRRNEVPIRQIRDARVVDCPMTAAAATL